MYASRRSVLENLKCRLITIAKRFTKKAPIIWSDNSFSYLLIDA